MERNRQFRNEAAPSAERKGSWKLTRPSLEWLWQTKTIWSPYQEQRDRDFVGKVISKYETVVRFHVKKLSDPGCHDDLRRYSFHNAKKYIQHLA